MKGFQGWLEAWSRRRAEKNRRFKIPCHLGVTGTVADGVDPQASRKDPAQDVRQADRHRTPDNAKARPGRTTGRCKS